jgi:3-deoxy-manno-octulosonate cytidylyltransferase (CMP-KDO synthetase)
MAESYRILIPARIGSERLPRKLLQNIGGKTVIQMTWERCVQSNAQEVIVVTDSEEIFNHISAIGGEAFLSKNTHDSGTDRIREYTEAANLKSDELIINVQGDEPMIEIEAINKLGAFMSNNNHNYGTLAKQFTSNTDLLDSNKVKVIVDTDTRALEFFRDTPNVVKDFSKIVLHHVGVYAYQAHFLHSFSKLTQTQNELSLKLEQMRALDNGLSLHVLEVALGNSWGIDTEEDLLKLRQHLESN